MTRLTCLVLCILLGHSALSNGEDLFELSLQQLMQVEVVSGFQESIRQSPGTVSSYYPEQLQNMGLHSLGEMLGFAASTQFNDSPTSTDTFQIRGLSDSNNQKLLFLIDGAPYWMPSHGDIPLNGIPLSAIEKIEVIRGPASVIYGTNSSSGVINLVTKKNGNHQAQVIAGENGLSLLDARFSQQLSKGHASLSLGARQDQGYQAKVFNTFGPFSGSCFCFPEEAESTIKNRLEYQAMFASMQWQDLSIKAQLHEEQAHFIANSSVFTPAVRTRYGKFFSARYDSKLEAGTLSLYSDWNQFYWKDEITNFISLFGIPGDGVIEFRNSGSNNVRWLNGVKWQQTINQHVSVLTGLEYEERSTEESIFRDEANGSQLVLLSQPPLNQPFEYQADGSILLIEADEIAETSAFIQADIHHGLWRYVVGLRHVDNEKSGSYTAPRISAVWSFANDESIKILYGEGFNSPTFRQLSARDQLGIKQNIDVEAEVIRTSELAWVKTQNYFHESITFFYTEADKLIQTNASGISNSNTLIKRQGIEYEFNYTANTWNQLTSISYLKQGNQQYTQDPAAEFNSQWLLRAGLEKNWGQHTFGSSLRASSERFSVNEQLHLNLHYAYEFNHYQMFATINNILEENIYHPDVRTNQNAIIQASDKANAMLGIKAQF